MRRPPLAAHQSRISIMKREDKTKHGHYRTQETILQIYDALTEFIHTSHP